MSNLLQDKIIVITGGNKGLGKALALASSREGARVAICGRDAGEGNRVIKMIKESYLYDALFVKADLSIYDECVNFMDRVIDYYGKINGLVNYAGILPSSNIFETDEKLFDEVFDINIKAPLFCIKIALKSMLASGGGSIINIGSPHAYGGEIDRTAYACSKGALLTLTKHIANNYAKDQVRCNWITMGWVPTQGELELRKKEGRDPEWLGRMAKKMIPMGRLQTVDDHIDGLLYLLSDLSGQVTGTELHFSGAYFPRPAIKEEYLSL